MTEHLLNAVGTIAFVMFTVCFVSIIKKCLEKIHDTIKSISFKLSEMNFKRKELKQMLLKDLIPLLNDNTEIECKDQSKSRYYIFNKEKYSCYSNLYKDVLDDKKVIRITAGAENNLFILVE